MDHQERWFEVDASIRGARHFDKKYGSGAPGYKKNSSNYFDRESFEHVGTDPYNKTPYINPRTGINKQKHHTTRRGKVVIWDFIL